MNASNKKAQGAPDANGPQESKNGSSAIKVLSFAQCIDFTEPDYQHHVSSYR
jgi:hypothetical protein